MLRRGIYGIKLSMMLWGIIKRTFGVSQLEFLKACDRMLDVCGI